MFIRSMMVWSTVYKLVDLLNSFGLTLVTWSGSLHLVKLLIFVVFYFLSKHKQKKKVSMLANVSVISSALILMEKHCKGHGTNNAPAIFPLPFPLSYGWPEFIFCCWLASFFSSILFISFVFSRAMYEHWIFFSFFFFSIKYIELELMTAS